MIYRTFISILLVLLITSCKKDWLDAKPDNSLVVPNNLTDLQALLDNDIVINIGAVPSIGEIGCDDYYQSYTTLQTLINIERNAYSWASDVYQGASSCNDWNFPYVQILYANTVLKGLEGIPKTAANKTSWENIMGSALYIRGHAFFNLVQTFSKQYDSLTANTDLGIPMPLTPDFNIVNGRGSVDATYNQAITDLTQAIPLLSVTATKIKRPSKIAAYGMLARLYLSIGSYKNAFSYADSSLKLNGNLYDFNSVADASIAYPIPQTNPEVIYQATLTAYSGLQRYAIVDSSLYKSYDVNDLRRTLFFSTAATKTYRGSYMGSLSLFAGLANDEIYLIRAESNARLSNTDSAMNDLNMLLRKRWKNGTFTALIASSSTDALEKILTERRKELVLRGNLRWIDLRRLNKDPNYAKSITRIINGQTVILAPNDPRYIMPIPNSETLFVEIAQNPR